MSDTEQGPTAYRAPERLHPPEAPLPEGADAVRVTGADFNGRTFDGAPFKSAGPGSHIDWLMMAISAEHIKLRPADTDYAQFDVLTPDGWTRATCDDRIVQLADGSLRVFQHWSNERA